MTKPSREAQVVDGQGIAIHKKYLGNKTNTMTVHLGSECDVQLVGCKQTSLRSIACEMSGEEGLRPRPPPSARSTRQRVECMTR